MLNQIDNIRRNHSLEHATVQLLIRRLGPTFHLAGRASGDGFFIYGDVPQDALAESAAEALERLQSGEAFWAITPLCGTNIVATGMLASLAALAVTSGDRGRRDKGKAITAGMLAVVAAQPLGRWIQRYITTTPDLAGTEIVSVDKLDFGHLFKVRTRRIAAPEYVEAAVPQ